MPDHDVTLKLESHNHMENYLRIKVNFVNEAEAAGIWILPQTEDNILVWSFLCPFPGGVHEPPRRNESLRSN